MYGAGMGWKSVFLSRVLAWWTGEVQVHFGYRSLLKEKRYEWRVLCKLLVVCIAYLPNLFKQNWVLPSFSRFWGSFTKGNLFTKCLFLFWWGEKKPCPLKAWQFSQLEVFTFVVWEELFCALPTFVCTLKGKQHKREQTSKYLKSWKENLHL